MIIFIKGRLATLNQFADSAAENIQEEYAFIDVCAPDLGEKIAALNDKIDENTLVVTFNNEGISLSYEDRNYWALKQVTFLDIIVDHSEYFLKEIEGHLYNKFYFTSIDRAQTRFLKKMYPEHADAFLFCPHGGTEVGGIRNKNRDIDILYVGNGIDHEALVFPSGYEVLNAFFDEYYSREKYPNIHDAIAQFCEMHSINTNSQEELELVSYGLLYVKYMYSKRRYELISSLCESGLNITIVGGGVWEKLRERHPDNITLLGFATPEKCLDYISRAKILINDAPFSEGAHERVFNGMLNGAVVLTNTSKYIEERFNDWQDILLWDGFDYDEAISKIYEVLADDSMRSSIVDNAYRKVESDSWGERIKGLQLRK